MGVLDFGRNSTSVESMSAEPSEGRRWRVAAHAALGEMARLAIVDELVLGDRSPSELAGRLSLPSNLLAHHLRVLEEAGLVVRGRSEADRRRTYVRLLPDSLDRLVPGPAVRAPRVVFVCTHNSARSQLASALWERRSAVPVTSAGTRPAQRIHRRTVSVARRHGLRLDGARTAHVSDVLRPDDLVVAVCDSAYEELGPQPQRLHWSVPDPVRVGTRTAFEQAYSEIEQRVDRLVGAVAATPSGRAG
jgi:ArsR family transcriptional regulator, arsenate/arsenite/antimonite-responsive transcriptional repressor / arsenate reductase (thioredoxin)